MNTFGHQYDGEQTGYHHIAERTTVAWEFGGQAASSFVFFDSDKLKDGENGKHRDTHECHLEWPCLSVGTPARRVCQTLTELRGQWDCNGFCEFT